MASLLEDGRVEVWIGTFGGGLLRFDRRQETFERLLPDEQVMCLTEDDGRSATGGEGRLTRGSGRGRESRDNPNRKDRAVSILEALAATTLTRKMGGMTFPLGIVWASKPEYLPEVDQEIGAHVGLRFSLPSRKP